MGLQICGFIQIVPFPVKSVEKSRKLVLILILVLGSWYWWPQHWWLGGMRLPTGSSAGHTPDPSILSQWDSSVALSGHPISPDLCILSRWNYEMCLYLAARVAKGRSDPLGSATRRATKTQVEKMFGNPTTKSMDFSCSGCPMSNVHIVYQITIPI